MTASLIGAAVRRLALSGFGRAARSALALSVALSAPLCALLTYIAATQSDTLSNPIGGGESFRVMLVVDFLVALLLAVLVVGFASMANCIKGYNSWLASLVISRSQDEC